jgi:hypothetical protein
MPTGPPPTDGDVARATLHYQAERDEYFRTAIQQVATHSGMPAEADTRDPGLFTLGAPWLISSAGQRWFVERVLDGGLIRRGWPTKRALDTPLSKLTRPELGFWVHARHD